MYFPAATKGGGACTGFPDVCKVPAPPGPPIPTPFPNIAQVRNATGTVSKVKVKNKDIVVETSTPASSQGDEPGVLRGVARPHVAGKAKFLKGSSKVFAAGKKVVIHTAPTAHNGENLPSGGVHSIPSQTDVLAHV